MRVIIAGSRTVTDQRRVDAAMSEARNSGIVPTVVLSGCAPGVDTLGEAWAAAAGVPVERHPANWAKQPRSAGTLRNTRMAHAADACVVIWDGKSPGSKHMIETARARGLPTYVFQVNQ